MKILRLAICGIAAMLITSCAYHMGSPLASKYDSIALDDIANVSKEATLTYLMKNAMTDRMLQEPGLAVDSAERADLLLNLKVTWCESNGVSTARKRDEHQIDTKKQSTFTTVLFRMSVAVEYEVCDRANPGKSLLKGSVIGEGYMPLMHDREVTVEPALRAASLDAANKIMTAICEI